MLSRRRHRLLVIAGIALVIAAGFAGVAWRCYFDPQIRFLPPHPGAAWIVYPSPANLKIRNEMEVRTVFRRTFSLADPPPAAPLVLRAHQHGSVRLNGQIVELSGGADDNWKRGQRVDVAPHLKSGENTLEIVVASLLGPPALWCALELDEVTIRSDERWESSRAGAASRTAVRANKPITDPVRQVVSDPASEPDDRQRAIAALVRRTPAPIEGLWLRWQWLLGVAIAAAAIWAVVHTYARRRAKSTNAPFVLTGSTALLLLAACSALWAALFWNNAPWLDRGAGFDASAHLEYVDYLLDRRALPRPEDGFVMFHPPLYYAVAAGWLTILDRSTFDDAGVMAIRALGWVIAVLQMAFVLGSLRLVFPAHPRRQLAGFLLCAFIPVHWYLAQFVTPEPLLAMLCSAAVYLCLRLLIVPQATWRTSLLLGACLGAAALVKMTALGLLLLVLAVLAGRLIVRGQFDARRWIGSVGIVALVAVMIGGGHYARMWRITGHPFYRASDAASGQAFWLAPGVRAAPYYLRGGRALIDPLFSGFYSFADGIYATAWGDGMCAGANARVRPPWNERRMAAGYLLALVPTLAIAVGSIRGLVELVRRPRAKWFLLLGLQFGLFAALAYELLAVPHFSQAKAFYAMSAMVPLCVFAGWGFDLFAGRRTWLAAALWIAWGTWAINSLGTFWIHAGTAATHANLGFTLVMRGGDAETAESHLVAASELDPESALAHRALGALRRQQGRSVDAITHFERAVEIDPDDDFAHLGLAHEYHEGLRIGKATQHIDRIFEIGPYHWSDPSVQVEAYQLRAQMLTTQGRIDDAVAAYREVLRIDARRPVVHMRLALLLLEAGDPAGAEEHVRYSLALAESGPAGNMVLAHTLTGQAKYDEAIQHYRAALDAQPDLWPAARELARILAMHPRTEMRDGEEAVRLARQAARATQSRDPAVLDILAAAHAEAGQFDEAVRLAEQALRLAQQRRQASLEQQIKERLRGYRAGSPFRDESMLPTGAAATPSPASATADGA